MHDFDRDYFARFALDTDTGFDLDDSYVIDIGHDDDEKLIPIDDELDPEIEDEPLDDDYLF